MACCSYYQFARSAIWADGRAHVACASLRQCRCGRIVLHGALTAPPAVDMRAISPTLYAIVPYVNCEVCRLGKCVAVLLLMRITDGENEASLYTTAACRLVRSPFCARRTLTLTAKHGNWWSTPRPEARERRSAPAAAHAGKARLGRDT